LKILLTGHKGFIGSQLLVALEQANHEVTTYEWSNGVIPSVIDQDWVIHVGAISSTTEKDVEKVMRQNVDFTEQLYRVCKTFGVNFQFSSSASVYGLTSTFKEDAPVDPRTPYAWSKYLGERYINRHMGSNTTQIFRYFNVYGPEGEEHKGNQASPFYKFTKQAKGGIEKIQVFDGSNNYHRDFIHVSQIVDMHLRFLEVKESGTWNFGTGSTRTFLEVATEIAKKYPSQISFVSMPKELENSYQKYTCADMTKTNKTLNRNL